MTAWKQLSSPAALLLSTSAACFASTYFTTEQAQQTIFPGGTFTPLNIKLTPEQRSSIEKASDTRVRHLELKVWRVSGGGYFIVDEVLGKHEFITYAIALNSNGTVKQIEVMDYRESYGSEIRDAKWRAQFTGKNATAPLKLDQDIKNISGATLSSRHLLEGVRRILATYEAVLK